MTQYTNQQWEALLETTIDKIKSLAKNKGGEYSGDSDRLANFRRNAEALGLCPEVVWAVYAGKHWDALQTYVKDLSTGLQRVRSEPLDGRVDDLLVYLLLFKAMLEESRVQVSLKIGSMLFDQHGIAYCPKCAGRLFPLIRHDCPGAPL